MKKLLLLGLTIIASFLLSAQGSDFYFIENKGQIATQNQSTASQVRYYTQNGNVKMFLTNTGIVYQWEKYTNLKPEKSKTDFFNKVEEDSFSVETYRTDVTLVGANPNPIIETYEEQKSYLNFYLPQCSEGTLNVKHYKTLIYRNVYEGIDWVWKFTDEGIKYDFIVHPGADYKQIQLKFDDGARPSIDGEGNLRVDNQLGTLVENAPVSFSGDEIIESNFVLNENTLSISVGEYDLNKILVIDPMLIWGTYFGGNDGDIAHGSGLDSLGNLYLGGETWSTSGLAKQGYQSTQAGGSRDGFVTKLDSNGNTIWATYYGGSKLDRLLALAVDNSGNVYVGGVTSSTSGLTKNGFQNNFGGGINDAIFAKFSSSGQLLWATYYGGNQNDFILAITVDSNSDVLIGGATNSYNGNSIEFNGIGNPFLYKRSTNISGYFAKFRATGSRVYGSYYGGKGTTTIEKIKIDKDNNIYIAGITKAPEGIALNGFDNTHNSEFDIYLAKFNVNLIKQWATYFGGEKNEYLYGLEIDKDGNIYLGGRTFSQTGIFYKGFSQKIHSQRESCFLAKFNRKGYRLWGTYYAYNGAVGGYLALDSRGNVFIAGGVSDFSDPSDIAQNGFRNSPTTTQINDTEGYIAIFDSTGRRTWGTYYGGFSFDAFYSLSYDIRSNKLYAIGSTLSTSRIVFASNTQFEGGSDVFILKIGFGINEDTVRINGCIGDTIRLSLPNISPNLKVRWFNALGWPHIYEGFEYTTVANGGIFLWASYYDSINKIQQPLVPRIISIGDYPIADFGVTDSIQCVTDNSFVFNNTSTTKFGELGYYWKLGAKDTSTQKSPTFSFDTAQTHTVKLIAKTNFGCTDSIEKTVVVAPKPIVSFNPGLISFLLCEEEEFTPVNQSSIQTGSLSYEWDFGTGDTTSQKNPTYFYNTQGNYTIQLKAISDNGCIDSLSKSVKIDPLPTANTILGSGTAQRNTQRSYFILNTTTNSKYSWDVDGGVVNGAPFGDSLQVQWGVGTLGTITLFEETEFGCTDTVAIKNISLLNTSLDNTISGINYSVYPVPANNYLILTVDAKVAYTLTDVLGKQFAKGMALPSVDNRVETSQLSNGVYLLQLHNSNSVIATQKVVVRH